VGIIDALMATTIGWNVEHNQIHHYSLGEIADPDLVENNLSALRVSSMPMWAKRAKVYGLMMVWKWIYYAPNTFKMLKIHELRRRGQVPTYHDGTRVPERTLTEPWLVHPSWLQGEGPIFFSNLEFFGRVLAPLFVRQFLLLPGFFGLVLGPSAATRALVSLVLAELLTNVHSFIIIVTNHAGADLYRFDKHCEARTATFYLRQVISSANFATGGDLNDFFHGWLNYQIEHHCWPDLSMLSYQKAAPLLRQICAKHGVPYVQQSVWSRLWKTIDIMTGVSSMRRFPNKWEHAPDLAPADRESSSKRL
jgi:fatty acid desaturase